MGRQALERISGGEEGPVGTETDRRKIDGRKERGDGGLRIRRAKGKEG
jgi:hypothetical protein